MNTAQARIEKKFKPATALSGSAEEKPACLSIFERPDHLRGRYRRLALVSHERHLRHLDPADEDTLIISSDWLLWQQCWAKGLHCITWDEGLLAWQEPDSLDKDINIRAADWAYVDSDDVTSFRGVSLGRLFAPSVVVFMASYIRLDRALRKLIDRYRPQELIAFDYLPEFSAFDEASRRFLVSAVAGDTGIVLIEKWDALTPWDPALPMEPEKVFKTPAGARIRRFPEGVLRFLYARGVDWVSRVRKAIGPEGKRILLAVNTSIANPLMAAYPGGPVVPVLLFENQNKHLRLVFDRLRRGILLAARPLMGLDRNDRQSLRRIRQAFDQAWSSPAIGLEEAVRLYVRANFLNTDHLETLAREVKVAERVLDRYAPARVVVDGVRNAPLRIYIELAHRRNIAVDYTWHSPIAPKSQKWEALGGDPRCPSLVDRCLSWGEINDTWCKAVGAGMERVRTGTPIQDRYEMIPRRKALPGKDCRILVLDYNVMGDDVRAPTGLRFDFFVRVTRILSRLGYRRIQFKLHPGRPRKSYYEKITRHFRLACTVHKHEPFSKMLEDADIVIGPAFTGARFEALAAGRAYIGFFIPPNTLDGKYYENEIVLKDVGELEDALNNGRFQDNEKVLNAYCARTEILNAAERFWIVMEQDASSGRSSIGA